MTFKHHSKSYIKVKYHSSEMSWLGRAHAPDVLWPYLLSFPTYN